MKCNCERCNGEGKITCPECDGRGSYEGSIESIKLEPNIEHHKELLELQRDANRVKLEADRLKLLRPDRAASYDAQLRATLFVINSQADAVTDKKPK